MSTPGCYQSANSFMDTHAFGKKKCTSCAQVHDLPWAHWQIWNNRESKFCLFECIVLKYYAVRFVNFKKYTYVETRS